MQQSLLFSDSLKKRLKWRKAKLIERTKLQEFSLGSCPPTLGLRGIHWSTSGDQFLFHFTVIKYRPTKQLSTFVGIYELKSVNQSYANFKICGIEPEVEQKLDVMFSTVVATGEFSISPGCNVHVISQDQHQYVEASGDSVEANPLDQSLDDLFEGGNSQAGVTSNRKRTVDERGSANPSLRLKKEKRQSGGAAMLAKHLDTLVTAMASRSSTVTSKVVEPEVPTLRACVADMKTIPGLDIHGELFMFSTKLLEEKIKREV